MPLEIHDLPSALLLASLVTGVVAARLLWLGLRPRRRGDTPSCRGCGYLLIGNESGRCPECGRDTRVSANVVRGERRRRNGAAAAGVVVGLLAALCLAGARSESIRQVDWYQHGPTSWVLDDLASPYQDQCDRAWDELSRRRAAGKLSASDERRFTDAALRAFAENSHGPATPRLVSYLADRLAAGQLADAQADRFFGTAVWFGLAPRSVVLRGDEVPFIVYWHGLDAPQGWWHVIQSQGVWVDAVQVQGPGSPVRAPGFGSGESRSRVGVSSAGPHTIEARYQVAFGYGQSSDAAMQPTWRRTFAPKAAMRVVEHLAPGDDVRLADIPAWYEPYPEDARLKRREETRTHIRDHIRVSCMRGRRGLLAGNVRVDVGSLPMGVAFDVFVRDGEGEHRLGAFAVDYYDAAPTPVIELPDRERVLDQVREDHVDVVLRTSPAAARQTLNLNTIWSGELVYSGVPVAQAAQ